MHEKFIHRCLTLAQQARGKTGINPMVGAVLVRNGKIIAEGFHAEFGKPHAECVLLNSLSEQKISSSDILYVSLEPCCHTHKKTPPCAQMLVEKGVKHVVYGMKDPNPEVSGKGIDLLIKNNVQVSGPILEQECKRLNRGFVSLMTKGRPWITIKKAQMVDGRIANDDGSPLRITSKMQDEWSHSMLRAKHDAILVGVGTVIADDPQLTVRFPSTGTGEGTEGRGPWRVILDASLQIPLTARVVRKGTIVVASSPDQKEAKELEKRGVRVLTVSQKSGIFDWNTLWNLLITPESDFNGISSILVEGGAKTWEIFRKYGMVDEEVTLLG